METSHKGVLHSLGEELKRQIASEVVARASSGWSREGTCAEPAIPLCEAV